MTVLLQGCIVANTDDGHTAKCVADLSPVLEPTPSRQPDIGSLCWPVLSIGKLSQIEPVMTADLAELIQVIDRETVLDFEFCAYER